MAENKALAPVEKFHIASPMENWTDEEKAEYLDQLSDFEGGGGIDCRNVTVQAGGNIFFKITGETPEDQDQIKELQAVIIFAHNTNNYWSSKYGETTGDDDAKKPDCSSMDGKTGWSRTQGCLRACADCPQNKFGTDSNGRGKACRNSKNLYLMRPGDPSLYRLSVPATSLTAVNRQISKIMAAYGSYTSIVLNFTLKPMEKNGNDFSVIQINAVGSLPAAEAQLAKEMRRQVKAQYEADKANVGSYEITEAADDDELPIDNVPQSSYADPGSFADLGGGDDVPWPDDAPPAPRDQAPAANKAAQTTQRTRPKSPGFGAAQQQAVDVEYEEAPSL